MQRLVATELLDHLPPTDSQATGSRADLRRLNIIMGHAGILSHAFFNIYEEFQIHTRPLRVLELGAGDGTLLMELARRWSARGVMAHITLLDRQSLVADTTRQAIQAVGWSVETVAAEACAWLEASDSVFDVILVNLFLHHFEDGPLAALLQMVAKRTHHFLACEPRRSIRALAASKLIGLLGCNGVTRHDAVASVRAGFVGQQISALWPSGLEWEVHEYTAGWFSHGFTAHRHA